MDTYVVILEGRVIPEWPNCIIDFFIFFLSERHPRFIDYYYNSLLTQASYSSWLVHHCKTCGILNLASDELMSTS